MSVYVWTRVTSDNATRPKSPWGGHNFIEQRVCSSQVICEDCTPHKGLIQVKSGITGRDEAEFCIEVLNYIYEGVGCISLSTDPS